jgi:malonate-semialdehyde dehydrogenase (acetylating)/methylmalonate-semialdehyde dehydrogenase
LRNYIDGDWVSVTSSESLPVSNPATGELLGRVPLSSREDVDAAVQAARRAFPAWRETPAVERARVFFKLKTLMERDFDELAESLAKEHGKTLTETGGELRRGIENIEHVCGIPTLVMGETLEDIARGIDKWHSGQTTIMML